MFWNEQLEKRLQYFRENDPCSYCGCRGYMGGSDKGCLDCNHKLSCKLTLAVLTIKDMKEHIEGLEEALGGDWEKTHTGALVKSLRDIRHDCSEEGWREINKVIDRLTNSDGEVKPSDGTSGFNTLEEFLAAERLRLINTPLGPPLDPNAEY